ncbi:MAG TPA: fatty acid desaturase, partial [Gammaproteobacteria bacterium]|nr:fatty acid desaturase [Gammaproteobacteria bacterium]
SPGAFALFLVSTAWVLLFGHSLGSHRKLIHDSFQCPKPLEYFLVYCGVQVGLAGPLGLLRQHELRDYAQRLPACHDYLRHGRSPWLDAWWQLNCALHLDHAPTIRIEPHIAEDRFYLFLERTWMLQQLPWALIFYAWGGWGFVFWGVCARVTAGVFGHWFIGYFAHNHGGMHHEVTRAAVQGRNVRGVSLLTMGECWHNNHHAYPGSAKLGLYPGEWDAGWWMLSLLRRLRLVWSIRLPQDLAPRPELRALDGGVVALSEPHLRPIGLREAWKLCQSNALGSIRWPGSVLSGPTLRSLIGSGWRLENAATAARLELSVGDTHVTGLPAVCIALARRGHVARMLAVLLLPFGLVAEWCRYELAAA